MKIDAKILLFPYTSKFISSKPSCCFPKHSAFRIIWSLLGHGKVRNVDKNVHFFINHVVFMQKMITFASRIATTFVQDAS